MEKNNFGSPEIKEVEVINEEEPPSSLSVFPAGTAAVRARFQRKTTISEKDTVKASKKSLDFLKKNFPDSTEQEWRDWQWQLRNSYCSLAQLEQFIQLSDAEKCSGGQNYNALPVRITPYYASLLSRTDALQPLRKTVIPVLDEYLVKDGEKSDPLCEEVSTPVSNIVQRYPDRVLFLVTGFCATYCRYCTRSRMVAKDKGHFGIKHLEEGFRYIESHPEIRDVLLSGGDPLTMSDSDIQYLLTRLKKIRHVEFIRMGTKVPVVLPQRITLRLVNILRKFHPLWLSIHFTHPDELTPEVTEACERLADAGIPLGSQTVLLKGVNDDASVMKKLMHGLLKIRVRPYYLYQCDPVFGSEHFRTPVQKGLDIIAALRGHTSGYAVPTYVIDAPGGGGKIPILPEYYLGRNGNEVWLRNYEGKLFKYIDRSD